jgi:hypothetical protein
MPATASQSATGPIVLLEKVLPMRETRDRRMVTLAPHDGPYLYEVCTSAE